MIVSQHVKKKIPTVSAKLDFRSNQFTFYGYQPLFKISAEMHGIKFIVDREGCINNFAFTPVFAVHFDYKST